MRREEGKRSWKIKQVGVSHSIHKIVSVEPSALVSAQNLLAGEGLC